MNLLFKVQLAKKLGKYTAVIGNELIRKCMAKILMLMTATRTK